MTTSRRIFIAAAATVAATNAGAAATVTSPKLVHHVFFWLKNPDSKEDLAKLLAGLRTLAKIETVRGTHFGVPASTEKRDVVDNSFSASEIWIAYARMDGSWASELFIIPAAGDEAADPARNVTRFATYNAGVTWSKTGNKLAFISERRGPGRRRVYVMSLQKPAVPRGVDASDIDWDDIHLRVDQPTPNDRRRRRPSPPTAARSPSARGQNGDDLWVASVDGRRSRA